MNFNKTLVSESMQPTYTDFLWSPSENIFNFNFVCDVSITYSNIVHFSSSNIDLDYVSSFFNVDPLFYNDLHQMSFHCDPPNSQKTQKSSQNLTSKRTRGRDLEKGSASKGSNLQKWQRSHTLSCFSRCPELPKLRQNGVHNGASGHPKSQKTFKNEVSNKTKKRAFSKVSF